MLGQKCGKARSVFDCIEQAQLRAMATEKMKKVVMGFDEVEEERNSARRLIWHAEMSPSQKV